MSSTSLGRFWAPDSFGSMPCTKQSCGRLKARTLFLKVIYYFTVSLSVNFLDVGCNDT